MNNIFDVRTFNIDEQRAIKTVVDDTETALNEIADMNSHMGENIKNLCERLNEGITDPEMKIKPSLLKSMARAKIKNKEDIEKSKNAISEVETGLQVIYKM